MSPVREAGLMLWGVGSPEGFVCRMEAVPESCEREDGKWRLVRRLLQ